MNFLTDFLLQIYNQNILREINELMYHCKALHSSKSKYNMNFI